MDSELRARGTQRAQVEQAATNGATNAVAAAAAAASNATAAPAARAPSATATCASAPTPPLWWRAIRLACFAPVLLALLLWTLALVGTLTHSYPHPLAFVTRFLAHGSHGAGPASNGRLDPQPLSALGVMDYRAEQTCEMSYFSLAHKHIPITRLSALSSAMLAGQVRFGLNASTAPATTVSAPSRPARRRHSAEYDEDEEDALLAAAEAAEELEQSQSDPASPAAASPSAAETSDADKARAAEFASFRRIFLNSLPTALSANSSSRYKLFQYVHHADGRRDVEKYAREPHDDDARAQQQAVPAHNRLPRVPVLFLHGNGGSFHQMRSLASRLAALAAADRARAGTPADPSLMPDLNDYFSIDMFEESAALAGRLGWGQAWFANEALHHILAAYPAGTRAVLVGHSMAGLVCRLMFSLGNFPRDAATGQGRVALVATLGSPHRAPVVLVDDWMAKMYAAVNARPADQNAKDATAWEHLRPLIDPAASLHHVYASHTRALLAFESSTTAAAASSNSSAAAADAEEPPHPPMLISVAGGERDFQVEAFLTDLAGIYSEGGGAGAAAAPLYTVSVAAHSLHWGSLSGQSGGTGGSSEAIELSSSAPGSIDHQCLAWCAHLVDSLAASVVLATRHELAARLRLGRKGYRRAYRDQRDLWVPPAVPVLRGVAAAALAPKDAPVAPTEQPLPQWPLFAENFTSPAEGGPAAAAVVAVALGSARALLAAEGAVFVWAGLMLSVELCVGVVSACTDLSSSVTLLAPMSHPTHTLLSEEERAARRLGLTSTFLLHLSAPALARLFSAPDAGGDTAAQLRFQMHEAAHASFARLRPLRGGALRQIGFGMAYRAEALPLSGGAATLPNAAGLYTWSRPLPAGLDLHVALQVAAGGGASLDNEFAPPRVVALFGAVASAAANDSAAAPIPGSFEAASFADQLFAFYPCASGGAAGRASSRPRMLHFYRSGLARTAVGVLLRLPQLDGLDPAASAHGAEDLDLRMALVEQAYHSFLHTLYLQAHLAPQMLLGAALLVFAAQFDCLRRRGVFPRPFQLLLLPLSASPPAAGTAGAVAAALRGVLRAPLLWVGIGLALGFFSFFHGGLDGAHILSSVASAATPGGDAQSVAAGTGTGTSAAALWGGWGLSGSGSAAQGLAGLVLFLSCVFGVLALEAGVYALLWGGRRVFRAGWWLLSRPFRAPSPAAAAAVGSEAAAPVSAMSPQRRYLSTQFRRLHTGIWVVSYALALLFSLSLLLLSLSRLGGFTAPLDLLHALGREVTAWASTLAMVLRVSESHFYYARDLVPLLLRVAVWFDDVHAAPLVVGIALAATAFHAATFPAPPQPSPQPSPPQSPPSSSPSSPSPSRSQREEDASAKYRSAAAHKASSVALLLLVGSLLSLPTLLGSSRLDVGALDRAMEAHKSRAGGSSLFFWPPGGVARVYEGSLAAPPHFAPYGTDESDLSSSAAGPSAPLPDVAVLVPFGVRSLIDPLVLVSLCWVTLLSWCALHTPFSPPLLQSVCIGAYGLALLFVRGAAATGPTAFANLPWVALMLCLCMVPHALSSALFVLHLLLDRFQGTEGLYERILERERSAHKQRGQQSTCTTGPHASHAPTPAPAHAGKKTR